MKVLVISNTNGNQNQITKAIKKTNPDAIFHLGNGLKDLGLLHLSLPMFLTKSPNDHFIKAPVITKVMVENTPTILTYGNKYHSNKNINELIKVAKKERSKIVLFGYGEKNYIERDGIIFINPGEISTYNGSCLLLEIKNEKISTKDIPLSIYD